MKKSVIGCSIIFPDTPHARFLPSIEEMAAFEERAIVSLGGGASDLMENAGTAFANVLFGWYAAEFGPEHPFVVLCGPGKNGGDGFVLARRMREGGCEVAVVVAHAPHYSPELTAQIGTYIASGEQFFLFSEEPPHVDETTRLVDRKGLAQMLSGSWLIIDALLGAGQKDAPRGNIKAAIECINEIRGQSKGQIKLVSVDVPSGVNPGTGEVYTPHITADVTVTFEVLKRGMAQFPAREACGLQVVVPVGIDCAAGTEFAVAVGNDPIVQICPRRGGAHKGDFGKVFIVGGSRKMPGAPVLAAQGALKGGAGLVTRTEFGQNHGIPFVPESLVEPFPELDEGACGEIVRLVQTSSAFVVGPGLGQEQPAVSLLMAMFSVISAKKLRGVIDADALNVLARLLAEKKNVDLSSCVLTPHPGEMARLLGCDAEAVQKDRYEAARRLSRLTKAVVVLKGASTVIYNGEKGYVNMTGNPYMATPGSGDVLSGLIAALIAQGKGLYEAAVSGVYYHGVAGDLAHEKSNSTLCASDIACNLPEALGSAVEQQAQSPVVVKDEQNKKGKPAVKK